MASYIFGGDTGQTPESIRRQRELAAAIMGQSLAPDNVGEGFAAIANGIVANVQNRRANRAEQAGQAKATSLFDSIVNGIQTGQPIPRSPSPATGTAMMPEQNYAQSRVEQAHEPYGSLIQNESGGNWQAQNDAEGAGGMAGHFGRLQFGRARLQDAKRAGVIPPDVTPEQFMASPDMQRTVEQWHFADIDQEAERRGLNQYLGQTVGGVRVTPDAIRAMAHLGGIGGAERFLTSGGQYNPADENGTTLRDYGMRHGGMGGEGVQVAQAGGGIPAGALPQQQTQGAVPVQELMRALSSPWLTEEQRGVLSLMLETELQNQDPMRALQIEQMQLENRALRNPQPNNPASVREYQFYVGQERQQGREPLPYNDWNLQTRRAGADQTSVNLPGAPEIGTIPQGYEVFVGEDGRRRMRAIPGGPEDTSENEETRLSRAMTASDVVTTAAGNIRGAAANQDFGPTGTTVVGQLPWTDSAEVLRGVNVLKSQAAGSNLQQMRDASPTGGALGNVTERELDLLSGMSGALDPNSPTFLRDLDEYERTLLRTIHGQEAGDAIFEATRQRTELPAISTDDAPEGVEPDVWEYMTPEERALFQ